MSTAAIILTAGESRRMGRVKAYLPFRRGTFLSVLSDSFRPFCETIIAVFGFDGERLSKLAPSGVDTTVNKGYEQGMLTSLQTGLRHASTLGSYDRYFFTLVDHPVVEHSTLERLLQSQAPIAIPRLNGKRGHPVLISARIAQEFLLDPPTAKTRDTIDRNAADIDYIDVADSGIHDDIDNPELYEALLAREIAPQQ